MAALALPAFRPSRAFVWMIVLSMVVHALFLYGVRVKTQSLDVPSALTLKATLAAPGSSSAEPIVAPPRAVAQELPA